MERSKMSDAYSVQKKMLIWSGIWPVEKVSFFFRIRTTISWILAIGLTTVMAIEVMNDLTDITKLAQIVYLMVTMMAYLIKLCAFKYNTKIFLALLESLNNPLFLSHTPDLDIYLKKTIRLSTIVAQLYRLSIVLVVILFGWYPVLDHKDLPAPFPYQLGHFKYVMYVFQIAGLGTAAWNNSTLDVMCTSLLGIAAAQFEILKWKIMRIRDECSYPAVQSSGDEDKSEVSRVTNEMVKSQLKHCVKHHVVIIKFVSDVERVFTFGVLVQFLASIIVICNTMFNTVLLPVVSIQFTMVIIYFVVLVTQLSMYCWYGNEVIWKSSNIGRACYMSDWYNCENDVKKYLFIIMERSNRSVQMTAMKFASLSLSALKSAMQWSYSYFTLLMKLYKKSTLNSANT